MTLMHSPRGLREAGQSDGDVRRQLSTRRPLLPTAVLGGVVAAGGPLMVCLAVAVVGWFVTDAGGHGSPSGALRVGALGWLTGHGSGVTVEGVRVTAVPLGLTLLAAWTIWRVGHRVGESVSGHGPDAERIADGERDWTVPLAAALFAAGYVVVAVLTATLASTAATAPSTPRVVGWSLLLTVLVGLPAISRGSGRAATWVSLLPPALRAALVVGRSIVLGWLLVATAAWVLALALDLSTAANVVSQLDADAGDAALISLLSVGVAPNATLWSSAYLLGPGFSVGTGTLISPGAVILGPLPMVPLLAALPDASQTSGWTGLVMLVPALVAIVAAAWAQRRLPRVTVDRAAVRGCGGGLLAGVVVGALTGLSGGAVGPGRLQSVGPFGYEVLLHAMTAFGIGGLLGALVAWWWRERGHDLVGRGVARVRRGS
jgi:hypothetical protein